MDRVYWEGSVREERVKLDPEDGCDLWKKRKGGK